MSGNRPWTAEEDAQVKSLWPDQLVIDIAKRIDRSPAAVGCRAEKLGLPPKHGLRKKREPHECAGCGKTFMRSNKYTTRCQDCHDRPIERFCGIGECVYHRQARAPKRLYE